MSDTNKTKKELIAELKALRQRLSERDKSGVQESNDSFMEKIMNSSPSAIAIHREGKILYVNPACIRLMKIDKLEQVLGKSVFDFLHPNFHKMTEERLEKARKGTLDNKVVEEKFICMDGSVIDVEVIGTSSIYQGQPAMRSIFLDITERKETEKALQESEMLLKKAQEMAHIGSWRLDLQTNELFWSDEVYRIFGLEPQAFDATYEAFLVLAQNATGHATKN